MMIFKNRTQSLSGKLTVLFVLMTVLLVILSATFIGSSFKRTFNNKLVPHIDKYVEYLIYDLGSPPNIQRANKIAKETSVEIQFYSKQQQWSTNTHKLGVIDLNEIEFYNQFVGGNLNYRLGAYKEYEVFLNENSNGIILFVIPHHHSSFNAKIVLHFFLLFSVLALFYYATKRVISPVHVIKDGIKKIGDGEFEHRLSIDRKDELGELATHINIMADDIQSMLDAKRQLLLAISHELRTPLTRAKVATAMLKESSQKQNIDHDLQEMDKMVEELLEAERLSSRHYKLNKSKIDLTVIIESIVNIHEGKVIFKNIPDLPVNILADLPRIKLLVKNLVENGIRHTSEGNSPVEIEMSTHDHNISITVSDYGEGIPSEHLAHIMEPFYRVDPARQRMSGGYGLGLYLCRVICESHNGVLTFESVLGMGTTAKIILPKSADKS